MKWLDRRPGGCPSRRRRAQTPRLRTAPNRPRPTTKYPQGEQPGFAKSRAAASAVVVD
ncbi:MAG: hypothetical protein R2867_23635 [Caldilineaceae bacterium]